MARIPKKFPVVLKTNQLKKCQLLVLITVFTTLAYRPSTSLASSSSASSASSSSSSSSSSPNFFDENLHYFLTDKLALPKSQPEKPTLPDKFHVIVEWNDKTRNKTEILEEWYDEHAQKGTVSSMSNGMLFVRIMDFKTKEMFEIADNLCLTVNMTKSSDSDIFGDGDKMLTPAGVLRFGGGLSETYLGSGDARGIPCDIWEFSGEIKYLKMKQVNIVWYFADPAKWVAAIGKSRIPIVSYWNGVKLNHAGFEESFSYTYEYVKWEPGLTGDPSIFQTPSGVFCDKRINTKPMPKLPFQFTLTIEEVKAESQLKRTTRFWYDQTRLLARYDHMPVIQFDDFDDIEDFEGRPLREIHDFHTGLAYTIDELRGNCSIRDLSNSIDSNPSIGDSPFPIMKEPDGIFHLENSNFHYLGRRIVRETEVDVWIGKPIIPLDPDGPPVNPDLYNYVVEWLVLAQDWRAVAGISVEGQVPMQLIVYKKNFPNQVWNFNQFDSEKVSVLNFDIQSCFRAFPVRKHFQFSIAAGDGRLVGLIDDNINAFKEALIEAILASTGVRPMRISHIFVDDDDQFIYVLFSFTEAPRPGDGGIGSLGYPDVPLSEATKKLENAILEEKFVISLIVDEDEHKRTFIQPVRDSLVETYRPGGKAPLTTSLPVTTPSSSLPPTSPPHPPTSSPPSPEPLKDEIRISMATLLSVLLIVPIVIAGLTVGLIFVIVKRFSVVPR